MLLLGAALLCGGLGQACAHRGETPEVAATPGAASTQTDGAAAASPQQTGGVPDLSAMSEGGRRELETVLSDEFCYCGCPHTLGACLEQHPDCNHAKRMFRLAASDAAQGVPAVETIVNLQRYYASFRAPRAELNVDPRQCRGPESAPVQVVAFSDFECPYCAAAAPMLEALAAAHADEVRLCVVPFPIQSHPNAIPAGQAALYARDQGKYWQMHDALFAHQRELSPATLVRLGKEIGLDEKALGAVLASEQYTGELKANLELGRQAGVSATPMVYFNGRKLSLPLGPQVLTHTLGDELEWRAHHGAWQAD